MGDGSGLSHGGESGDRGLVRKEGIAGRAGDFARRSYSETFEHLFHESAYYVRRRRGCRAKEATRRGAPRRVSST